MRANLGRRWLVGAAVWCGALSVVFAASAASSPASTPAAPAGDHGEDAAIGFLSVSSVPPAHVKVDDKDLQKMTPIEKLPLPPGSHKLTLTSPDKSVVRSLGFKIVSGETTRLKINL